jgi:cysteinyl-tRNA synthetase
VDLTLENCIENYMSELCKSFWSTAAERVTEIQQALQRANEDAAALRSASALLMQCSESVQNYLQQTPQDASQGLQWVTEIHRLLRFLTLDMQFVVAARQSERRMQRLSTMNDRLNQLSAYIQNLLELL